MCGISLCIEDNDTCTEDLAVLLKASEDGLLRRGPDAYRTTMVAGQDELDGRNNFYFSGAVLRIQGNLVSQPYEDEEGNLLLWNGEVFGSGDNSLEVIMAAYDCDTVLVSDLLRGACKEQEQEEQDAAIVRVLSNIHGPFAFIYYHANSRHIVYGRDPFGRRSLLRGKNVGNSCTAWIASVSLSDSAELEEVPIGGVFVLNMEMKRDESDRQITYPLSRIRLPRGNKFAYRSFPSEREADEAAISASTTFQSLLRSAVQRRVDALTTSIPSPVSAATTTVESTSGRIGVLFSGGVDSVLLAAILHSCLSNSAEPIDLINVTFFGETDASGVLDTTPSPDRLAAISALVELEVLFPTRPWNLVHVDVSADERMQEEARIKSVIFPCDTHMDLNIGTAFWFASRAVGYCRGYTGEDKQTALNTEIGGRPLMRIGGEGAARGKGQKLLTAEEEEAAVVGEKSAHGPAACLNESCILLAKKGCANSFCAKCCHKARGTGASVNQCSVHKQRHPKTHNSTFDDKKLDSLAECDNAFAQLPPDPIVETRPFTSSCRVLLVGIGADEQMAGYGRHRTTFLRGGEEALAQELDMDLGRLYKRNLGRDDRCLTDHGKEAWFPYLDEDVVTFLHSLSLREIADLRKPSGKGDKQILRRAAASLGLGSCAELVKRAVQFGTRIAKHTNIRELGSNRKGKGGTKIKRDEEED